MPKMPKILVFTYYWPPSGGPAVQRWLALSQLLPHFGIEPIVVTVDEKYASYVLIDDSLNQRIPASLEVHKTKSFEILNLYQLLLGKEKLPTAGFANQGKPSPIQKAMRWIRGNFFFPDPRKGWNRFALKKAREIIAKENIVGVITAGPPHSTHLIGLQLQKEFNLFWLCDFHDAWVNVWYYHELLKTKWAQQTDQRMELQVLKSCDAIITVGQKIIDDFSQKLKNREKITLHSMGYDDHAFGKAARVPADKFVICYTGTMAANYEPRAFFAALQSVINKHHNWQIELHLYGLIATEILSEIEQLKLGNLTKTFGYVNHQKVIDALQNACMLLLVNPNIAHAEMIIPGKIYEYLATGLPILNLATKNTETTQIIEECSAGKTFERTEVEAMAAFIEETYLTWEQTPQAIVNTKKVYQRYSRKVEAEKLAKLIADGIAAKQ
ncbi:glycosyltransferase [bacterium]|nr:glycosyltransferase [bacterium]